MGVAPAAVPGPAPSRAWRDLLSLSKPGITLLIVFVAVGGFFVALPSPVPWARLGILVVTGAAASAGAAMLNHYFDRDLDARMRRTRGRPLPGHRIAPEGLVLALGLALSGVGIAVAAWLLNPLTGFSIFLGGFTYVVVYTVWLKRRSNWNIVIGGFAGSAPALAGSAAAVGTWSSGALAFALLVFLWTPPHFWSLALLLREDYRTAGLPMLPDMDDPSRSGRVVVVSAALLLPASFAVLYWAGFTVPAAVLLVGAAVGFLVVTAPLWRTVTPRLARRGFLYSGPYLLAVIGAVLLNALLRGFGVGAIP
jgi:protoheme IX farnesyltransferase